MRVALTLKHIDLQVWTQPLELFETFFGLSWACPRQKQIVFFKDETGFEFAVTNLFNSPPPSCPPDCHTGFILESAS
jgi:hypothetical protein